MLKNLSFTKNEYKQILIIYGYVIAKHKFRTADWIGVASVA